MARTSIATDNFNRANGTLGANWTYVYNLGFGSSINITSNEAAGNVSGAEAVARWTGAGSFTADQYSSAVVHHFTGGTGTNNYTVGVVARCSADTDANRDYYFIRIGALTYLGKVVNGTETVLNSGSISWVDGDTCDIECEGTAIRLCQNGTPAGGAWTQTDSSIATGLPGILGAGDSTIASLDNWEGGNMGSGAAFTPNKRKLLLGAG